MSPDGAEHVFGAFVSGYAKTLDASRFYLHNLGTTGYEMWDEDGNRYVFDWEVTGFNDTTSNYINDLGRGRDGWYVRLIEDPWLNGIVFQYQTNLGVQPCWAGVCKDPPNNADGTEHSYIVKNVQLPGSTPADPTVEVLLNTEAGVTNIIKTVRCKVSATSEADWTLSYVAGAYGSPALSSVTLPVAGTTYNFTYGTNAYLSTMKVPTGAMISYFWGGYSFHHSRAGRIPPSCHAQDPPPATATIDQSTLRSFKSIINIVSSPDIPPQPVDCLDNQWTDVVTGVVRRTETVGGVNASTDYDQWAFPFGERGTSNSATFGPQTLTLVTYPPDIDGRRQAMATLFTAAGAPQPGSALGADVRVAYYDHDPYPTEVTGRALTMPLCGAGKDLDLLCIDKADRVIYRTYDYADNAAKIGQRRLLTETTDYGKGAADDTCPATCKFHKVAFSLSAGETWEGNGRHYNIEKHSGNPNGGDKTITTTWDPPTTSWFPNIFTRRQVSDAGAIALQQTQDVYYSFDADGFLTSERTWDASASKILLHCMYPDGSGNVDSELWKTGTLLTDVCSGAMPAVGSSGDEFGQKHTSEDGQLKSTCWIQRGSASACQGAWYSFRVERDDVTGLTTWSKDTAGQQTDYTYDSLGRVKTIDPPGTEVATNITYNNPNQTTVTRTGDSTHVYTYDGLGRLTREQRTMADGTPSYQHHLFDDAGHAYFDSEWTSSSTIGAFSKNVSTACLVTGSGGTFGTARPSAAPGTYRLCYDPFGRPQQVMGSNHSSLVLFDRSDGNAVNSDTLEKATTYCVNGTFTFGTTLFMHCSGTNADQITSRDALGRVTSVTEPTGDVTTYSWDVSGKLAKVVQGAGTQNRTFVYNRLGLLTSETNPEIVGATSYSSYDGLGNVLQKSEGGVTHVYTYDAASRLSTDTVGANRYLMDCYDGAACPDSTAGFAGGSSPLGKLTRRVGANPIYEPLYPQSSTATIGETEDFAYSGLGGRLSSKATTIAGGANAGSTETWTYNNLGLPATFGHPRVANGVDSAALTETYTYANGMLSQVVLGGKKIDNSAITAVTITPQYTPAGTLKKYTTAQTGGQTQVTTITQDANLLPRPSQISTSLGGFDTGAYTYDGAGNVLSTVKDTSNQDTFTYDSRSRLLTAAYKVGGSTTSQGFTYDLYGNLVDVSGTNARPLATSTATNRLTQSSPTYDNAGNLTKFGNQFLYWDGLNRQTKDKNVSTIWQYLYQGDQERLARTYWWGTSGPSVTRREAARYFTQGEGWSAVAACTEAGRAFSDVHCADQDWPAVQAFFEHSITTGCGSGAFCPDTSITRGQMMVFLLKVAHGSAYAPPACVGNIFADVTCGGQFDAWIEQASRESLTSGCGGSNFCPTNPVTEYQMAVYLNNGAIAPSYRGIPGGTFYTLRDEKDRVATEFYESFPGRDNVYLGNLLVASYVSHTSSGTVGWNFHSSDHLGTVRLTVNGSTGGVIESLKYWPYGDRYGSTAAPLQKVAFAAMERDTESNHYFDHARKQDFNLGRFVSVDSLGGVPGDPQSWNRFSYARGNPLVYADPDGRSATLVGAIIGAVGGGGSALLSGGGFRDIAGAALGGAVSGALVGSVIDTGGASLGVVLAAGGLAGAEGQLVSDFVSGRQSTPFEVASAAAQGVSGAMLAESAGALSQSMSTVRSQAIEPSVRPEIQVSGGRGGQRLKNLTGPPDSVVKGSPGRAIRFDSQGRAVADITADRVKPITPGQGFGEKRPPTAKEMNWLKKLFGPSN